MSKSTPTVPLPHIDLNTFKVDLTKDKNNRMKPF